MTLVGFAVTIVVLLVIALALAMLKEATQAPPTYNPFASDPFDSIL